uniref:ORF49h n=1 Tax=Pinus koraiensis TaxID=88728 RepID=A4QM79_PINKO|nr:ORF49h [Pinus koraiensis]
MEYLGSIYSYSGSYERCFFFFATADKNRYSGRCICRKPFILSLLVLVIN